MTRDKITAGVDCGKSFLDISVYQCAQTLREANDAAGHAVLIAWLKDQAVEIVGMEASGGYERAVRDALSRAGFDVQVFDPGRVRHYARSKGRRAKNDRIDAGVIAEFTAQQTAPASPVDPAREEVAGLIKARRLPVDKCADLRRALATAPAAAKAALQTAIDALKAAIKSLENETNTKIKAQPALSAKTAALAIPSICCNGRCPKPP
jgi:transposase